MYLAESELEVQIEIGPKFSCSDTSLELKWFIDKLTQKKNGSLTKTTKMVLT